MVNSTIGSWRRQSVEIFQHFGLAPFRAILTSSDFASAAAQSGCAALRFRPLTPEVLVWLMTVTALTTSSFVTGLSGAWGLVRACCPWLRMRCVSEEAFCQARNQLPLHFWRRLWQLLRDKYEQRFGVVLRWKGLRVLAADGSEADVPNVPALVKFFTRPKTQQGESRAPQGRLVALCSVFTGYCVDFVFISRRFSEHVALKHLLRRVRAHDLLLLDRGFFSYGLIYQSQLREAHFLMRLSVQAQGYAQRVRQLGPDDWLVEFRPGSTVRNKCPGLPGVLPCRLIRYQLKGFRPSWLLTSLQNPLKFPASELVAFYHRRWRIETIYRELKHVLDIQNLRSLTPAGILKEMHAQLLLYNLVRYAMTDAAEGTGKTPVEYSFTAAIDAVSNALLQLCHFHAPPLPAVYAQLLEDIRRAVIRLRPGRSYPRRREGKRINKGNGKFLLSARLETLA
jgi:hypothetical protein